MIILYLILTCLLLGVDSNTQYAKIGDNKTLSFEDQEILDEILWKHNGNKIAEWEKSQGEVEVYPSFKGRLNLNTKTGHITLSKLAKKDSGSYVVQLFQDGNLYFETQQNLEIIDPVTDVSVTCNGNDTSAVLYCSAQGQSLEFSWSGPSVQDGTLTGQRGPQVNKHSDAVYRCKVKNPVSETEKIHHVRNCFPTVFQGPVSMIPTTNGDSNEPKSSTASPSSEPDNLTIILAVVIPAVIVIAAVVGLIVYCKKCKGRNLEHIQAEQGTNQPNSSEDGGDTHARGEDSEMVPLKGDNENNEGPEVEKVNPQFRVNIENEASCNGESGHTHQDMTTSELTDNSSFIPKKPPRLHLSSTKLDTNRNEDQDESSTA